MEDYETAGGREVSSALAVGHHAGYLAIGQTGYLRIVEPVAVVVVDADALVRAYPDIARGVNVEAGYVVAEYSGHALHELRPVPSLADERVETVALGSDIDFVVAENGDAAALAGHADFKIEFFGPLREAVENGLCENPCDVVAALLHRDGVGRELAGRYNFFAAELDYALARADEDMPVVCAEEHGYRRVFNSDIDRGYFLSVYL